ncbi:hypothetical protein HN803_07640 [candidate division WWE3 bacterium]|nr:hypothetical protein [candidate division WWE3 bacterium]
MSGVKSNEQIIHINDNYVIGMFDEYNFALKKKRVVQSGNNTGDIKWDVKAWCGSFKQVMDHAERNNIIDTVGDATEIMKTVTGLHKEVERIGEEIKQLIKDKNER